MSDNVTETQEATIPLTVELDADYGSPLLKKCDNESIE